MNIDQTFNGMPVGALDPMDEISPIRELTKKKMLNPFDIPVMEGAAFQLSPMLG
jgi:hypothetical protein